MEIKRIHGRLKLTPIPYYGQVETWIINGKTFGCREDSSLLLLLRQQLQQRAALPGARDGHRLWGG